MASGASIVFTEFVDIRNGSGLHEEISENEETILVQSDQQKLKKLVRKSHWSIQHPIRQHLWKDLCLLNKPLGPSVYEDLAVGGQELPALPQFVDKKHILYYQLNESGQRTLHTVMFAIENAHPDITYCPLLQPITSLLLHYIKEDTCYECLVALLQEQTCKYLHQTRVEYEAFLMNFKKIAAKFVPQTFSFLNRHKDGDRVLRDWVWLILQHLPFSHLVQVIDCFLVEGLKVLYRVALAIVDSFRKSKGAEHIDDLVCSINEFTQNIPVKPNELLKAAFQFRGFSRATISSFQHKNQIKVRSGATTVQHTQDLARNVTVTGQLSSTIINESQLQFLWRCLPERVTLSKPKLIFSTNENGYSLTSLFTECGFSEPLIILVKTIKKEVIGAYLSTNLEERNNKEQKLSFFGTGECFLFTLIPQQQKYAWVGHGGHQNPEASDQLFIRATSNMLVIGGGGGDGLHLNSDLDQGWTSHCNTFGNPPLVTGGQFQCSEVEICSFVTDE